VWIRIIHGLQPPRRSISASEFVELYVGMGAQRVRELFSNARKEAPAIVFIDEIDAVAKVWGSGTAVHGFRLHLGQEQARYCSSASRAGHASSTFTS
jgi:hypothetical protein